MPDTAVLANSTGAWGAALSKKDFDRLSRFIHQECGIRMPDSKLILLEARLRRRMRVLEIGSFSEYCDYLFSPEGMQDEMVHMLDAITTNKTEFFREANHFRFLVDSALPELRKANPTKTYSIWSAGCSTGEEPYTLAMVLSDFAESHPGVRFSILATDISTRVLEHAGCAIYSGASVTSVPMAMKMKYLLRGKDKSRGMIRVGPQVRSLVRFRRLNLMDGDFAIREPMDIIFCRNVLIYFDRDTQERVLSRLCRQLIPGGYLFVGCSETLCNMNLPLQTVGQMVYRKPL